MPSTPTASPVQTPVRTPDPAAFTAAAGSAAVAAPSVTAAPAPRPRLCVVGPLTGCHPGRVTSQGEILADGLELAGYPVRRVSREPGRLARLVDVATTLLRERDSIDTVILQVFGGPSFVVEDVASAIALRSGHRVVAHLHGGAMPRFMRRHPRWTRRVLSRADLLVTPSPYLAEAVAAHGFAARVVPNVLDLDDYDFRLRSRVAPRLFWMRSFHPIYNPLMAVRVLAHVATRLPDATLVMGGGDLGEQQAARAEAARLGVAHAVRFAGFLDAAGKRREAAAADVFLNTNRVDNAPVAVLEAAASGLPVVATAVGGLPYLLRDEETGLLVGDDDAAAMAAAVLRLVDDPALAARLSENGRRLAERSAWPRVLAEWERVLCGGDAPAAGPAGDA